MDYPPRLLNADAVAAQSHVPAAYQELEMRDFPYPPPANVSRLTSSGLALSLVLFSVSGFASDVGCKAVFDATLRQTQTPYHSHTTMTLVPGEKPRLSEQINTGGTLYLLTNGKWTISKITPQAMRERETDNIKNSKALCSVVRDEPVDGVVATLYKVHEERDGAASDSQVWISKANGLPLRMKMEQPAVDSHYSYSDVVAPSIQ
jgi:hypothetical protein